jgi:hypothetical protein
MTTALIVVPSKPARIGWPLFECAVAVGVVALAEPWQTTHLGIQRSLLVAIGVVLFAAGIEFTGRKVVIEDSAIRERLWFHWRTFELPYRVQIGRDVRGRVAVAEASTGRIVFRFVREFGRSSTMEKLLSEFFSSNGRLAPAG